MMGRKHTNIYSPSAQFIPSNCWKSIRWFHASRIPSLPSTQSCVHTNAEYNSRLKALFRLSQKILLTAIAGFQPSHQPEPRAQYDYRTNERNIKKQNRTDGSLDPSGRIKKLSQSSKTKPIHPGLSGNHILTSEIGNQSSTNPGYSALYSMLFPI